VFDSDLWEDIIEKLYSLVQDIPDFKQNVFMGDRYPPVKYPCAFIVPSPMVSKPITFTEDEWYYSFEIGIGVFGSDVLKNMKEAFRLANKVGEVILADRHLTIRDETSMLNRALVHNTNVTQVIPNWKKYSKRLESYWIGVFVICQKKQ